MSSPNVGGWWVPLRLGTSCWDWVLDGINRVALICRDKVDSNREYSHTCLDKMYMGPGANQSACRSASGDAGPNTDTPEWPHVARHSE